MRFKYKLLLMGRKLLLEHINKPGIRGLEAYRANGGYRSVGYAREVCLAFDPDDESKWVHEFQIEVVRP